MTWDRESIVEVALPWFAEYMEVHGRPPQMNQYHALAGPDMPSVDEIKTVFGSWEAFTSSIDVIGIGYEFVESAEECLQRELAFERITEVWERMRKRTGFTVPAPYAEVWP